MVSSWLRARWWLAGAVLAAASGLILARPPLGLWCRWSARRHGVSPALLASVLHAEARGKASAWRVEASARLLSGLAPAPDPCALALALGRRRFTRNTLAPALLADEIVGGLRRGIRGYDALGIPYEFAPGDPGCKVTLPPDEEGERVGASFARFWRATARREEGGRRVKAVVLHVTNGTFVSAVTWFQRPGARTSAHYVVRASDGMVVQMVDERHVAFHDACFNDESIGIEHEGMTRDGARWFTEAMYRSSARLVRDIAARHGIPLDRGHIVGHDEAPDCSEHEDPGPSWDWAFYGRLLADPEEAPRGG